MSSIRIFAPQDVGERTWGREILVAHTAHYIGKLLLMRAGAAGGLQYHEEKDETAYVYSGEAWIDTDDGDGKLTRYKLDAGMSVHIPAGVVHRVTAITDCVFFEASTPHFDDRVRVEARYGEPKTGGLPTTR